MYPSSINRGYRSGIAAVSVSFAIIKVSILYQSRLSFWLGAQIRQDYTWAGIHPLSIEAIVLATRLRASVTSV